MAQFSFRVATTLTPREAWARVLDFRRHTAVVPLTRVTAPDAPCRGDEICARTALGPLVMDDVMRINVWAPPNRAELTKVGAFLGGSVRILIQEHKNGSDILWQQNVQLPWMPRKLSNVMTAVAAPAIRCGYRLTVRKLLSSGDPE